MCGAAQNNTCTKVKKTSQVLQGIQRADWLNHPELEREREKDVKIRHLIKELKYKSKRPYTHRCRHATAIVVKRD